MGPYEVDYKELILRLLTDWRVIAAFVLVFALGALMRYVGMVFKEPGSARAKAGRGGAKASRPAPPPEPEPEADDFDEEA